VEGEGDAHLDVAPGRGARGSEIHGRGIARGLQEGGLDVAGPAQEDGCRRVRGRGRVGGRDRNALAVLVGVEAVEIGLRLARDLRGRDVAHGQVLGQHQRGGIERRLHRGPGVVGAGIVDRYAYEGEDRQYCEGEHHRDVAVG
ncbi:hypothetical protein chiPu_0031296, partial [Chiloscyllium punctatum]|nr:hypothetical protein [Chiloscyllium punctatum]